MISKKEQTITDGLRKWLNTPLKNQDEPATFQAYRQGWEDCENFYKPLTNESYNDYCSYELSKKLYEKGFRWSCEYHYPSDIYTMYRKELLTPDVNKSYPAPTLYQAQKWLMEFDIKVLPCPFYNFSETLQYWKVNVYKDFRYKEYGEYDSYIEALEAGIMKGVDLIKLL